MLSCEKKNFRTLSILCSRYVASKQCICLTTARVSTLFFFDFWRCIYKSINIRPPVYIPSSGLMLMWVKDVASKWSAGQDAAAADCERRWSAAICRCSLSLLFCPRVCHTIAKSPRRHSQYMISDGRHRLRCIVLIGCARAPLLILSLTG